MHEPDLAQDDDVVMSLVELAMAQAPDEREGYLRSACAEDPKLFDRVWQYVQWEERMGGFLMEPLHSLDLLDVAFEPGQLLLDGRFHIVRKVGEGGMGIVYEAWDTRLDHRVALKFAKTGFRKRLPPEVRHAREVAHDNVCKIFEIHSAATDRGEIDFIVMEFLDGETLTARLQQGALPKNEACAMARQLAAGLAAAHRSQVIHGDLKSNNVILIKNALTRNADGTLRAVITDFGLAHGAEAVAASVKTEGLAVSGGAPDYMAPELWKGHKASVASDIYALGVIFYEMVTGTRLQSPAVSWEKRLNPKPPKVSVGWDGILAHCLHPDPARRYSNVEEIEAALAPRSHRWMLATAAAMVLAAVTGVVSYEQATAPETVRLAITPVRSDAATNPLLKAAAERLRVVKTSKTRLEVFPPGQQGRKATHLLAVDVEPDNGRKLVRATLSDAGSLPLKRWQAEYESSELRYLPVALAGVVTSALHLPPVAAPQTVNAAAAADFAAGVELARRDDPLDAAIPLLEKAVAADGDSPLTHARLAEALLLNYNLTTDAGFLERAKVSLQNAEKRNPDLALVWLVSGILAEFTKSYAAADTDLQRARELEPRNADIWRHFGGVYAGSNRLSEADVAYRKAIELEPGYFKSYQELCRYYGDHGNYDQAIAQCRQAIALAPDLASIRYNLIRVYMIWGHHADGEREARLALSLDPKSPTVLNALGAALVDQGQYQAAVPFFERRMQVDSKNDTAYTALGTAYRLTNQREKARKVYQKGADLARARLTSNLNDGLVRSHLAYLCAWLGDRREAEYEAGQALQLAGGSVDAAEFVVMTYEALNERERTLDLASMASSELLLRLKYDAQPDLAGLHQDSRFQQMIETHNIP